MKISIIHGNNKQWDKNLKLIECDLNTVVSTATGKAPFEALYGFLPRINDGPIRMLTENCETYTPPNETQKEIREKVYLMQSKYKQHYDKNRYKKVKYKVGDIVFMKCNPKATGESTKLQSAYTGPFVIIEIIPRDTYRIIKLNESNNRKYETTAHVSQLKIWRGFDNTLEIEHDYDFENSDDYLNNISDRDQAEGNENIENNSNKKDEGSVNQINPNVQLNKRKIKKPSYLKDYV
ncbi:hypothetical protein TKK_0015752 [Trichogramma kaykai]